VKARSQESALPSISAVDADKLYRAHVRPIYGFIFSKVGNREAAEDLTSEVFLRAIVRVDPGREERSVIAWLYRVARNVVHDYWRSGQGTPGLDSDNVVDIRSPSVAPDFVSQDRAAKRAGDILRKLPDNYRTVLQYRIIEGLSVAETAQRMAVSVANVKVLQHRALKRAAEMQQSSDSHA
jgi:RNA polymerase sigma-70 factor (ECF subfamily)